MTVHLQRLDGASGPAYAHLAPPKDRAALASICTDGDYTAVGAHMLGLPIGLAMARWAAASAQATVVSLSVANSFQNRGTGTALLRALTSDLAGRGCRKVSIEYGPQMAGGPGLERVLAKCGWQVGPSGMLAVARRPPAPNRWYHQPRPLPSDVELFDWASLDAREIAALLELCRTDARYADAIGDPTEALEPHISLGLRYKHEIVGWLHVRRPVVDTLLYAAVWVRADCRQGGMALTLLAEGHRRGWEAGVPWYCWYVASENSVMLQLVERYMADDVVGRYEVRAATIELSGPNSTTVSHVARPTPCAGR